MLTVNKEKLDKVDIKFEDVLEDIGGYGRFQKIFSFVTLFPQIIAALITLSPVFTGSGQVPLYCSNQTQYLEEFSCVDSCTEYSDGTVLSSVVQEWNLVCSRSWVVDAVTSCQMAGLMTGAIVFSLIADNFGRFKTFFFVTLSMGTLGMLPALATTPTMYAVMRFFAGFGRSGVYVVYVVHLMEFLTPSWRTISGAVSLWGIGEMLLGLITYLVPGWRNVTIITAVPIFGVLCFYPFIQESPRWLLTRRRTREAHQVLCKIAKWNSRPPPEMATVEALQATVLKEEADILKGLAGVKQVWKDSELRKHLAILVWCNIACAIVYYGIAFGVKSLSGDPHLNIVYMGIVDLLAIPAVLVFNDRLGRKKTFFIYMLWASCFLVVTVILNVTGGISKEYPLLVTISALLGQFGIVSAWGAHGCMIMESFPTQLRTSCLGFAAFAGYLAAVVAPQTALLSQFSPSAPYILYGFFSVTSVISCFFLREMAGQPLKDAVNSKY